MTSKRRSGSGRHGLLGTATRAMKRRDWLLAKIFGGVGLVLAAALVWSLWPYWRLSEEFRTLPEVQPSRLYGRPFRLAPGQGLAPAALVERLERLAYRPAGERGLTPGTFHAEPRAGR
ncbi:MAG: hypothetical protein F9K18_08365, partial [Thermoanaerobaculia bacterium]